jgi:heme exporter protein A
MNAAASPRPQTEAATTKGKPADGPWDIEARGLWKSFGASPVLRGLNLRVRAGERLVIVGPNGSGKSTLIRILATLLSASRGQARVAGFDTRRQANEVRRHVGLLCHQTFLYGELTSRENLRFYGRMYGVVDPDGRATELLRMVGLEEQANTLSRTLSRGMQQRLALARAILHEPLVLLLDEPDTGLDQHWAGVLNDLVAEGAAQGRTTLLTTHNLERSLEIADRVAVLNGGRIVFSAMREELDVARFKEVYYRHTRPAA